MENTLLQLLACPKCKSNFTKNNRLLVCTKGHQFKIEGKVPVFVQLDQSLQEEAKAWEDEWVKGVSKKSLKAYKKNMQIFRKLGFWEEAGEAAGFIPSKKDAVVLDLGCGNGVSTANIKGQTIVGVDLSKTQLIRAKKKFPKKHYVVGDALSLPFKDNSFDTVVAINVLHHLGNKPQAALKECFRVLKRGGNLLTVDPNLTNPIGFTGRSLYRLLNLKKIFPSFPQFALQEDEYQFTKDAYYKLFVKSPFKNFKIIPHRIERILFFATILIPGLINIPGYGNLLIFTSRVGNALVKLPGIDRLCYFWKGEAIK